jgi:hypothetical protein
MPDGVSMQNILIVSFILLPIIGGAFLIKYGLSHLFDVAAGADGVDLILFRNFVVGTINYKSISAVYKRGALRLSDEDTVVGAFLTVPVVNRIRLTGIIIKLQSGIFRYICVTPEKPDEFLRQVASRLG